MRTATAFMIVALVTALFSSASMAASVPSNVGKGAVVNIELQNVSVNEAIETLFKGRGLSYIIQSGISGKVVELKLKGISFEQALTALGDAADFTYEISDGTYMLMPKNTYVARVPAPVNVPTYAPEPAPPAVQTAPPAPSAAPAGPYASNTVNIDNSPVFYEQSDPGYGAPYGGYPNPPIYQFGNTAVIGGGGYGSSVVITGIPYVIGRGPVVPPPPGWVSPDNLRTLRHNYIFHPRPYFMTPYSYQGAY